MHTEISRSHSTTRGKVYSGMSQQGDGPTTCFKEMPASPFFMRLFFLPREIAIYCLSHRVNFFLYLANQPINDSTIISLILLFLLIFFNSLAGIVVLELFR